MPRIFRPPPGKPAAPHPDLVIAELAGRQHGVMSRAQLLAAGVSDEIIEHRLAIRRIARLHRGIYEIVGTQRHQLTLFTAAVLACGDGAVLSHRSAAALWGLRPQSSGAVDVSVRNGGSRCRSGIRVHTPRTLPPEDVTTCEGIPCTTVARTVIDCAGQLPASDTKRMLERAQILRLFDLRQFEDALSRARGRRGTGTVRSLIASLTDAVPATRSEFEHRFLALIDSAGLARPIVNGRICGYEVDFHWPEQRLIVETDGAETHATVTAFHRDRERDLDLALAGWRVIRITWRQLRDEPDRVLALLRRSL